MGNYFRGWGMSELGAVALVALMFAAAWLLGAGFGYALAMKHAAECVP
jgi:hypothetical protein